MTTNTTTPQSAWIHDPADIGRHPLDRAAEPFNGDLARARDREARQGTAEQSRSLFRARPEPHSNAFHPVSEERD